MIQTTIVITSYKEPATISEAIEELITDNKTLWERMEMIVVAPDVETIKKAENAFKKYPEFANSKVIKDNAEGKPMALNLAIEKASGAVLVLTDGDMFVGAGGLGYLLKHFEDKNVAGVSGHPVSKDDRSKQFGYYSHLFCEAAHKKRMGNSFVPMSGYLYAFRNIKGLFPLPKDIRAEDAYISFKLIEQGYKLEYEPKALAYVSFPKNQKDWIKQKLRSLGGNVQIKHKRSIVQDLRFGLFPLSFAGTPKELLWSLYLYPLRLLLWYKIYKQHLNHSYSKGSWDRIESSKA